MSNLIGTRTLGFTCWLRLTLPPIHHINFHF